MSHFNTRCEHPMSRLGLEGLHQVHTRQLTVGSVITKVSHGNLHVIVLRCHIVNQSIFCRSWIWIACVLMLCLTPLQAWRPRPALRCIPQAVFQESFNVKLWSVVAGICVDCEFSVPCTSTTYLTRGVFHAAHNRVPPTLAF